MKTPDRRNPLVDPPPAEHLSERYLIGTILLRSESADEVLAQCEAAEFDLQEARTVVREMWAMREAGLKIEPATLQVRLADRADWDAAWIATCIEVAGSGTDWKYHLGRVGDRAERLKEWSALRQATTETHTPRKRNHSKLPESSRAAALEYRPFPTEVLPSVLRDLVREGADAIGCDEAYLANPLLGVLGSAIGNSRRLRLKATWDAPPIVWPVVVGESGTAKTPALKLILGPVMQAEARAHAAYAKAYQQYEEELEQFERESRAWKNGNQEDHETAPTRPRRPLAPRRLVSDVTLEALAPLSAESPRGLLLATDELNTWFGSFDRYAAGKKSSDATHWLSFYSGLPWKNDRKTGKPATIYVPYAAVCVVGGIQPAILARALGREHRESGLAARLLLVYPPRKRKRWKDQDVRPETLAAYATLLERLYGIPMQDDGEGGLKPLTIDLSPEAAALYRQFYNRHAHEQESLSGDLAAAWSKLEETPARIALIMHCARWAADDPQLANELEVDVQSMQIAITLIEWYKHETKRIYQLLDASAEEREDQELLSWTNQQPEGVTARDVQRGYWACRESAELAEAKLERLVRAGLGTWDSSSPGTRGGCPTRRFRPHRASTLDRTSANPGDSQGCVDVEATDAAGRVAPDDRHDHSPPGWHVVENPRSPEAHFPNAEVPRSSKEGPTARQHPGGSEPAAGARSAKDGCCPIGNRPSKTFPLRRRSDVPKGKCLTDLGCERAPRKAWGLA